MPAHPRILLVDDDANYGAFIRGALSPEFPNLDVTHAASEEEVLKALEAGRFDLVVTECRLLWTSGTRVLAQVRERWPQVPVIMMGAAADEKAAIEALGAGLDSYVLKTSGFDLRLRVAVRTALDRMESKLSAVRVEKRLGNLLTRLNVGVFRTTGGGQLLEANPAFLAMLGFSSLEEARGLNVSQLYARAEDRRQVLARLKEHGFVKEVEVQFRRADGRVIWVLLTKTISSSHDGEVTFDGLVEDITERKHTEEALKESEERFALAATGTSDGLWDWNLATGQIFFSARFASLLGFGEGELGSNLGEWLGHVLPEDRNILRAALEAHIEGGHSPLEVEYRMRHRDGSPRWMLLRGAAVRAADGRAQRLAGSQTDITDRKESEAQLRHDALFDGLTGLANRARFIERLNNAIDRARRGGNYVFALLMLDMDRFKFVNDSLGHVIGDQLLIAVAHRLKSCLRPGDSLARLGGDEFAILLDDVKAPADATRVSDRIHRELETPLDLCGHEVFTTTSIGIAMSTVGYDAPEVMLRDADTAMHRAKSSGRARHEIFQASMHTHAVQLLKLEGDLRRALDRGEFRIHFQPIVSLETWKIAGFEALLRWKHPERGLVLPEEFVPLAEETGLIVPIAKWILLEACRQTRAWQSTYPSDPPVSVSVNLSSKNLAQPDLIEEVDQALLQSGLSGASLGLEITESTLIQNADHARAVLSRLKALNIRLHIDDFGTGYSSLSYLHQFPIDSLKIDRSFVSRMPDDGQNAEIVRTIVTLAKNLGLGVIAEGVETREQAESLRELDCELAQGFFFHKPLDGEQVKALLKVKSRTHYV